MFTVMTDALPVKQRLLRGRRLVVVDIENMVGGAVLSQAQADAAWRGIEQVILLRGDDHIVIGASHLSALAAGLSRPSARLLVRSGLNGADSVLLEVLDEENVENRFDEVVVISGDGIFADTIARLGGLGVPVTIVARLGHVARRLRMAAARVALILESPVPLGGVA